ncbi:MAG: Kelch repeat-containing protein [Acidiferrobacterales bacterium]
MRVTPFFVRSLLILSAFASLAGCGSHFSGAIASSPSSGSPSTPVAVTTPQWEWASGATVAQTPGTYTGQDVPASSGPGGRYAPAQWMDGSGNLWIFGGTGVAASSSSIGDLSDLWRYSPATNTWTWINGPDTINSAGSYGTIGVASTSNEPPARSNSVAWTDASGNLWLFGGYGYGAALFNDLWEYSPATNEWTWKAGSNAIFATGTYGTLGVASTGHIPGARTWSASAVDASGNVWIFGGYENDSSASGDMNDLWMFDPTTGAWTWESGAETGDQSGVYGTLGTAAAANVPGGRQGAMMWFDKSGNLWLIGGYGYDSAGAQGALNDVWMFNPSTREWTWEGGSATQNPSAVYGTLGTASSTATPQGVAGGASWTDSSGNFWYFGGFNEYNNELNDLWMFNPSTREWTWEAGNQSNGLSGTAGVYGTEGTASSSNLPGARCETTASVDASGNVWLFGGYGYDANDTGWDLNDLWRLTP